MQVEDRKRRRTDDAELALQVSRELHWDPRVDAPAISVQARDGVVTLRGIVDSLVRRDCARDAAHRVDGVLDVVDELTVRPPLPGRSDHDVAQAVRAALQWDAYLPDRRIRSTVKDGWVVLEGDVTSCEQRRVAHDVVARLVGVLGVTNHIVVRGAQADAGSVRRSIEEALTRRAAREARHVSVSVDGGVVTLTGTVRSWGEKNAIERTAGFAPGVADVVDLVVVDPWQ